MVDSARFDRRRSAGAEAAGSGGPRARVRCTYAGSAVALLMLVPGAAAAHGEAGPDAEARVRWCERRVAEDPSLFPAHVELGLAYLDLARHTRDPEYVARARRAVETSLALQPTYEAFRAMMTIENHAHRFQAALAWGERAADASVHGAAAPDPDVLAGLVEAELGLGRVGAARGRLRGVRSDVQTHVARARLAEEEERWEIALQHLAAAEAALETAALEAPREAAAGARARRALEAQVEAPSEAAARGAAAGARARAALAAPVEAAGRGAAGAPPVAKGRGTSAVERWRNWVVVAGARIALLRGDVRDAQARIARARAGSVLFVSVAGRIALAAGDAARALAIFEAGLAEHHADPELHHGAMLAAMKLGDDAAADRHHRAAERELWWPVAAGEVYTLGALARLRLDRGTNLREALALAERNLEYKRDREARATADLLRTRLAIESRAGRGFRF